MKARNEQQQQTKNKRIIIIIMKTFSHFDHFKPKT
jgi:hypothetical protein